MNGEPVQTSIGHASPQYAEVRESPGHFGGNVLETKGDLLETVGTHDRRLRGKPTTRRPSVGWSLLVASAVFAGILCSRPLLYEARLSIDADSTEAHCDPEQITREWREFAATYSSAHAPDSLRTWELKPVGPHTWELASLLPRRERDAGVLHATATEFLRSLDARRKQTAAQPTEAEQTLSVLAAQLRERLHDAMNQVEPSRIAGEQDPRFDHEHLVFQWQESAANFDRLRKQWVDAHASLERLRSQPPPSQGMVSDDRRRAAIDNDAALTQDLKELHLRLTEVRMHLLTVCQQSTPPLEQMVRSADEFATLTVSPDSAGWVANRQASVDLLSVAAMQYRDLITGFEADWKREFAGLRQISVDPLRAEILELHPRLKAKLSEFLYHGANRLAEMREQVNSIQAEGRDETRRHVAQSGLIRGFQAVQSAHHRFEFSAGAIDTQGNFQLDAGLQGARGLRRRSQHAIRELEDRLRDEALREMKAVHAAEIERASAVVRELRESLDRHIGSLLTLQNDLNVNAGLTAQFLQDLMHLEIAEAKVSTAQETLAETENRLNQLSTRRKSTPPAGLVLRDYSAGKVPIQLGWRATTAGICSLAAFFAAHFLQWRASRPA